MGTLGKELRKAAKDAKKIKFGEKKSYGLSPTPKKMNDRNDSILMHPTRQLILEYLSRYPCSYLSAISKDLQLSTVTASWHLKKMVSANFLSEKKFKGMTIFFPKGMIRNSDIRTMALINTPTVRDVLSLIINYPGITQKELAESAKTVYQTIISHANRLVKEQLIYTIRDGIFKRYYPTETIKELESYYIKIENSFEKKLIERMRKDGVNPKLVSKRKGKGNIQIHAGYKTDQLKVSFTPIFPPKQMIKGG